MMERKQAEKFDLTQIHAAFRAIGDGLKHFPPGYAGAPTPSGRGGEPDDASAAHGAAGGSRDAAGGSRDARPSEEFYCPPDHIHVGHLMRAFVEYGSERLTEDEARACAEIFKPNEQGFVNWRVWVEKNFEGYT